MEQDTMFEKMFAHIAFGLKEKLSNDDPEQYRTGLLLRQGINMFCALALQYAATEGEDLEKYLTALNEAEMIRNKFTAPVKTWFQGWNEIALEKLQKEPFWEMGQLIYLKQDETSYELSDECLDYLEVTESDLSAIDEHKVYNSMKDLSQEKYVAVRQFLIENPLLTIRKRNSFLIKYNTDLAIQTILNEAYESVPEEMYKCPNCGWTLSFKGIQPKCCHSDCADGVKLNKTNLEIVGEEFALRLKQGVARYISYPGKLEFEIHDFCKQFNLNSELWPELDRYDIKIVFSNGTCWGIDAKTFASPYSLSKAIKNDNKFYSANIDKGFYVISDNIIKKNVAYLKICNSAIRNSNFSCISMSILKKLIKAELKNG
ncbi:MAG: hypothetical protein K2G44_05600 [Clostridia bacterium]|nr:hypothetical protein [Clostridia bacterium]